MEVLDFIQSNIRNDFLDTVLPLITHLCDHAEVWIGLSVILIAFKRYRDIGFSILIALLLSFLIGNMLLKPLIARPRPFYENTQVLLLITPPADFSFPSGHTMSSFAAAAVVFIKNKRMSIAAVILAVLIGFSRMYLYVHYLSDVLAGAVIGVILGAAAVYITGLVTKKWFSKIY